MMHEARFGQSGYEFLGEYNETESMKDEKVQKTSIKEVRKADIMAMEEPPLLTLRRVMDTLDIKEQTAKILLTELENDMKIVKYGRGMNAIWKIKPH